MKDWSTCAARIAIRAARPHGAESWRALTPRARQAQITDFVIAHFEKHGPDVAAKHMITVMREAWRRGEDLDWVTVGA